MQAFGNHLVLPAGKKGFEFGQLFVQIVIEIINLF